jgi:hypothetical protein
LANGWEPLIKLVEYCVGNIFATVTHVRIQAEDAKNGRPTSLQWHLPPVCCFASKESKLCSLGAHILQWLKLSPFYLYPLPLPAAAMAEHFPSPRRLLPPLSLSSVGKLLFFLSSMALLLGSCIRRLCCARHSGLLCHLPCCAAALELTLALAGAPAARRRPGAPSLASLFVSRPCTWVWGRRWSMCLWQVGPGQMHVSRVADFVLFSQKSYLKF